MMNIFKSASRSLDGLTNGTTMYKGITFGLLGLIAVALILASFDVIGINPAGLALSVTVLAVSCFVSNKFFAKLFNAADNSESWLITALILACILNPRTSLSFVMLAALCGAIAMASKFVFTWRHSHIFNPAAFGAFVISVTGLLSANWWIATPYLLPVTIALAFMVLRKQRRFTMFFVFMITALAVRLLLSDGTGLLEVITGTLGSWPLIFLGSVMLTEPITLPSDKYYQLLIAVVVGALFTAQIHVGPVSSAPHTVLLVGNVLAALLVVPFGAWLKVTKVSRLAPDILELTFDKPRGLKFIAGQYMEWTLPHKAADIRGNRRTFTIASAPAENEVRLAVRTFDKSSSYKLALADMKAGDRLRVANVSGEFTVTPGSRKLLFIAGGIGITPFRSIIAQLLQTNESRDIILVYLASDEQHFVYKELLEEAKRVGVAVHYVQNRPTGLAMQKNVPDVTERLAYISGPRGMVDYYSDELKALGVSRKNIRTDHFSGY